MRSAMSSADTKILKRNFSSLGAVIERVDSEKEAQKFRLRVG